MPTIAMYQDYTEAGEQKENTPGPNGEDNRQSSFRSLAAKKNLQLQRELGIIITGLPPMQRTVLHWVFWKELTINETARRLWIDSSAVRNICNRGLANIKGKLFSIAGIRCPEGMEIEIFSLIMKLIKSH